jgi:hypothetical protein
MSDQLLWYRSRSYLEAVEAPTENKGWYVGLQIPGERHAFGLHPSHKLAPTQSVRLLLSILNFVLVMFPSQRWLGRGEVMRLSWRGPIRKRDAAVAA